MPAQAAQPEESKGRGGDDSDDETGKIKTIYGQAQELDK